MAELSSFSFPPLTLFSIVVVVIILCFGNGSKMRNEKKKKIIGEHVYVHNCWAASSETERDRKYETTPDRRRRENEQEEE